MELGKYADGRSLDYDGNKQQFTVGAAPVTAEQVVGYDQAGQITWVSDEVRSQGLAYASTTQASAPVAPPAPSGGWFSRLPGWGKVLFVIVYPISIPYGIWAMWKDKRYSQPIRIVLTTVGVIFLVVVAVSANSDDASTTTTQERPAATVAEATPEEAPQPPTTAEQAETQPAAAPAPAPAPQTKDAYLREAITDELGKETNMGDKEKIRAIEQSGGDVYWLVSLNGNENLTNEMTKQGMWIDAKDVWERVFTERDDIEELIIYWYFPLVDVKGNTTDEVVMKLWMTKGNAADVNWDNVLIDNIPLVADDYWESPVFSN